LYVKEHVEVMSVLSICRYDNQMFVVVHIYFYHNLVTNLRLFTVDCTSKA